MNIGKNIKYYREQAGLSQKDLAKLIGVSNQRLNNWEKGLNQPSANYIGILCHALNIKADDLLGMIQTKEITVNEAKLLRIYNSLTKAYKDCVMNLAESLSEIQKSETTLIIPLINETIVPMTELDYYPQAAGMGRGQNVYDAVPEKITVPTASIPEHTDFIVRVVGDSMEPTFSSGDRLFIQRTDYLEKGDIGAVNYNGEQMVKEIGNGELISHNKNYPPIKIKGRLVIQGKVLGKL